LLLAIALDRADHPFSIGRNSRIADAASPGIDDLDCLIDFLGVSGAQRDRITPVDILRRRVLGDGAPASADADGKG
jgi:hypothetical protein